MRRLAIGALLLLAACREAPEPPVAPKVAAAGYDAFYLWPGVRPAAALGPRTLYLLDGEVRQPRRFQRLRMGVPRLPGKALWLVVRANRLDWDAAVYDTILADLERWQAAGNDLTGSRSISTPRRAGSMAMPVSSPIFGSVCPDDGNYRSPA